VRCRGMRPLLTLTAVAALIATPATFARAQDAVLFTYFRSICTPAADPAAGAARAAEQGFAPAKKTPRVGDLKEVKAFEKTVGGREFFVITGRGQGKPRDGLPASSTNACGVGVKGKDEAAMAAGRKWVGVPVSRSVLGVAFHAFRQAGGARTPLSFDDKAATRAAVLAGDLNVLTVSSLGGSTVLFLSRSRIAS
jgi:hypothetical protein